MAFAVHLFSLKELTQSFFAPWKAVAFVQRGSIFSGEALTVLVTNAMSRFFGAAARSVLIFLGALFVLWVGAACLFFIMLWLAAPFLPLALLAAGFFLF